MSELGPISKAILEWKKAMENENIRVHEITLPVQAMRNLAKETAFKYFLAYDEESNVDKHDMGEIFGMKIRVSNY